MSLTLGIEQDILKKTNNADCLIPLKNPLSDPITRINNTFKSITDTINSAIISDKISSITSNIVASVTNINVDDLIKLPKIDECNVPFVNEANTLLLKNKTINNFVKDVNNFTKDLTGISFDLDSIVSSASRTLLEEDKKNILKNKLSFLKASVSDCPNKNLANTSIGKQAAANSVVKNASACNDDNLTETIENLIDNNILVKELTEAVIKYSDKLIVSSTGKILGKSITSNLVKSNEKHIKTLIQKTTKQTIHRTVTPNMAAGFKNIVDNSKVASQSEQGDFFHKVITTLAKENTTKPDFTNSIKPIEDINKYNLAVVG